MKEERDSELWQQAKARADFKIHLTTYLVINGIIWLTWLFTGGIHRYPWPIWPTMGWGIGIIFNYLSVYRFRNTVEKEYEKLKESNWRLVAGRVVKNYKKSSSLSGYMIS